MNRRFLTRMTALAAMLGLAMASLLLLFLLLDGSTVGAASERAGPIPDVRAQNGTFTVSGTVMCEATGPIPDVEVFIWDRDKGTGGFSKFTDSSGYYSVTLQEGNYYDLIFNPPCGNECASKAHKGITGPPDQTRNITLTSGYSVSGTVFATDGTTPISNVAIYAFNHDTADGFGLPLTDANGHYCIGLIEGRYDLGFTPPPCLGLGPKTEVIIVTGDTIRDVILPPGFTVAGRVTDKTGAPVSGVQIYARECVTCTGYGFSPSNVNGYYTGTLPHTGTLPTAYDIQFIPPPGRGLGSITVIDVISTISGCPNTTLPIMLPTGYTLSGKVTCKGAAIKNVFVYAEPEGPHDPRNNLPGWGLYTVDDGSYSLPLVSITYTLEFTPPPAVGLNTKTITPGHLITDTVLNVNMCGVCSGVWVIKTVDSNGNVGADTSLALEPAYPYIPHISYYDITSDSLKYARLSGTIWLSETVDPQGGRWTSLALVPIYPYTPCISYLTYWDEWDLRYACRDGITWSIITVQGGHRSGLTGTSLVLEPTYPYTPHISYFDPWDDDNSRTLFHAYFSSTTWVGKLVEPPRSEAGWWSSLALEPTYPYIPHISYFDDANDDLKYAKGGTTWLIEMVDSAGDVGWYTSLALDSSDNPHISYWDNTNYTLKYAWLSGITWLSETVDSTGENRDFGTGSTSLKLDQADAPHISYYDATNGDLKFAYFNGTVWFIQTVDSEGKVGQYSSLALDQDGCPHISYYDATNGDLKYAYLPVFKIYLPIIMKNY